MIVCIYQWRFVSVLPDQMHRLTGDIVSDVDTTPLTLSTNPRPGDSYVGTAVVQDHIRADQYIVSDEQGRDLILQTFRPLRRGDILLIADRLQWTLTGQQLTR